MTKRRFARRPEGYRCTRLSLRLLGLPMGLAARRPGMADLSGKVYEDKRPGLLIIARSEETAGLKGLVRPEAQARLQGLDYDHYFAAVVFQGWKTTNRYGVQIERIARWGSEVTIYARFSEPDPNKERGPEITSPYHLVQVKKVGRWEQEIAFQVVVDGINVTSLSHYVP